MYLRNILLLLLITSNLLVISQSDMVKADHIHVPFTYLYHWDLTSVNQDGVISENEYPITFEMNDLAGDFVSEVAWAHDNTTIAVGITINGTGWLGLGMGEVGVGMAGSDIIMASVIDNVVQIQDMKAVAHEAPIPDTDQYPFPSVGGQENNGLTTIEFTIPMDSSDTDGNDHFWHIGSEFGFFTAFRRTGDEFDKEHHAHSQSENVLILDASYVAPTNINHDFEVSFDKSLNEFTLTSQLLPGLDNHEVGFYQKTLFGELKIKDAFTNSDGMAQIKFTVEKTGNFVFTAIFFGDENHIRNQITKSITITEELVEEEEKFNDLRDFVGHRFMRSVLLFGIFFVITTLLYVYGTSIMSIGKISKIGKSYLPQKENAGGTKE